MAEFQLYTNTSGLVTGDIDIDDVKGLLILDEEKLDQMIVDDFHNYKYKLSFNEFL